MSNYRAYQQIIKLDAAGPARGSRSGSRMSDAAEILKPKKKITRTKTGCYCCRRRKKKCDEQHPICSGCKRNGLTCCYPTDEELNRPTSRKRRSAKKTTASQRCGPHEHSHSDSGVDKCSRHLPTDPKVCSIGMLLNAGRHLEQCEQQQQRQRVEADRQQVRSPLSPASPASSSACSECDSGSESAGYITPVSSPELSAYSLSPVPENQINLSASSRPLPCIKTKPASERVVSVRSLLN